MSEALEQNSLGFLEKDPNKLDIALKKLLFLDYLIYYDEESKQDESTIKKLSKGEIPVILKTSKKRIRFKYLIFFGREYS